MYPIVWLDAVHYKVMDEKNHPVTRAIYNVLALTCEGRKELLGMYISRSEGANFWLGVLTDLQNRGVQDILIACMDGLKGFPDAIASVFPETTVQLCIVHQVRNSIKYVASKNQKEFMRDLKLVYQAVNKDAAEKALDDLEIKWGEDYPIVIKSWRDNWDRLTAYFQYSQHIRRIIYTTNTVEGYHRQLRKVTKNKGVFTSDTALEKTCLSCIYEDKEEVAPTGTELGADGPAIGYPIPGQVQDLSLTTSFVWSSLTILIT